MRLELSGVKNQSIQYFQSHFQKQQQLEEQTERKKNIDHESVVSKDRLKNITETINHFIEPIQTNLKFELHEELNEYYVTIVNPKTNEVIREIPPKKMLDMYAAMVGFMGLLVDEKV